MVVGQCSFEDHVGRERKGLLVARPESVDRDKPQTSPGTMQRTILERVKRRLTPYRDTLKNLPIFAKYPPGHFYSPVVTPDEVERFWRPGHGERDVPGVDLREEAQSALLEELAVFYPEFDAPGVRSEERRYFLQNRQYTNSDAVTLFCMLRHLRPRRIVEVGSGYSSALMLDTLEQHPWPLESLTLIEPFPERLEYLLHDSDFQDPRLRIVEDVVQEVEMAPFDALEAGDLLFIDSSHVARMGSDVLHLFFEVLPRLDPGVTVHVHDVFAGFEYPRQWLEEGRSWNEAYLLRAFLQFNTRFHIVLFTSFMEDLHESWYQEHMPLCLELHETRPGPGGEVVYLPNKGQSLWMERVSGDG